MLEMLDDADSAKKEEMFRDDKIGSIESGTALEFLEEGSLKIELRKSHINKSIFIAYWWKIRILDGPHRNICLYTLKHQTMRVRDPKFPRKTIPERAKILTKINELAAIQDQGKRQKREQDMLREIERANTLRFPAKLPSRKAKLPSRKEREKGLIQIK